MVKLCQVTAATTPLHAWLVAGACFVCCCLLLLLLLPPVLLLLVWLLAAHSLHMQVVAVEAVATNMHACP